MKFFDLLPLCTRKQPKASERKLRHSAAPGTGQPSILMCNERGKLFTTLPPKPPKRRPPPDVGLRQEFWYHGAITREEAEALLSREGDFLVRASQSSAGNYVLSGRAPGKQFVHMLLFFENGYIRDKNNASYCSIRDLINDHLSRDSGVQSSNGQYVRLSNPIPAKTKKKKLAKH